MPMIVLPSSRCLRVENASIAERRRLASSSRPRFDPALFSGLFRDTERRLEEPLPQDPLEQSENSNIFDRNGLTTRPATSKILYLTIFCHFLPVEGRLQPGRGES